MSHPEPVNNLVTWIYDSGSFVPSAKIVDDKKYSILSDYIGRPAQAYDEKGEIVWEAQYDIYEGGALKKCLANICSERARWRAGKTALIHSCG